jgi:hypothetical protein
MGRYYGGDIAGKFWFAVQNSCDAQHFGVQPSGPHLIYSACMDECASYIDLGDPCRECSSEEHCEAIEHNQVEFQFDADHLDTVQTTLNNLAEQLLALTPRFAEVLQALEKDQAWTQGCTEEDWISEEVEAVINEVVGAVSADNDNDKTFNVLAARYYLGTQILRCLQRKGSCWFWCEL